MHTVKLFKVLLWNTNNSIRSFVYTQLNDQTFLFLTIQINVIHVFVQFKWSNSSIWPINRNLSGTTILGLRRPRSNGNEDVFHVPQSSRTETSPSDCLGSYPGNSLAEFYPSTGKKSVFSTAQGLLNGAFSDFELLLSFKNIQIYLKWAWLRHPEFNHTLTFIKNPLRKI